MAVSEFDDILRASAELEEANKAVLGLTKVYDHPPESLEQFPCSVRYGMGGTLRHSRGLGLDNLFYFRVEVHVERARPGGLAHADQKLMPFIRAIQRLYAANLSLNGACDICEFEQPNSFEYGELEWGGVKTLGVRFNMWAKYMLAPITVDL